MKNAQHARFWLLLVPLCFFLGPLVRSGAAMERFVREEIRETRLAMGEELTEMALSFANGIFHGTLLATFAAKLEGVQHTQEQQRLSEQVAGPGGALMSSLYNSYLQGLALQTYLGAVRAAIVLFWVAALAPLLLASVYDGLMQRAVKQAEFGSLRPATFTLASLAVIPLATLPLLYLTLPLGLSPLFAPLWAVSVAAPLAIFMAHSQPLLRRS